MPDIISNLFKKQPTTDDTKIRLAEAALKYIEPGSVIAVGVGSTVDHFINVLGHAKPELAGVVTAFEDSAQQLKEYGFPVLDINDVSEISVYFGGANQCDHNMHVITGSGGTLAAEKILATVSQMFVCLVTEMKLVDIVSGPVPIEVIPMARSYVARQIVKLGGEPLYREHFVTAAGNVLLDIYDLDLVNPAGMEKSLNNIAGIVATGLFGLRHANTILAGNKTGVRTLTW